MDFLRIFNHLQEFVSIVCPIFLTKLRLYNSSISTTSELGAAPPAWNASADAYCFRYTHPSHPGAIYLLKLLRMDQLLMAYAVRKDDGGRVLTLELNVTDACDAALAAAPAPPHRAYRNADSLLAKVDASLVQPILPASAPAPSQASPSAAASSFAAEQRLPPQARRDPLRADDDDYDPLRMGPVRRPQPRLGDFDGDFGPAGLGPMGMGGPLGYFAAASSSFLL